MLFLVDENLPIFIATSLAANGHQIQHVIKVNELRGKPDEAIFDYARQNRAIIITRDIRFANPTRFPLHHLKGMVLIRFPNDISMKTLINQFEKMTKGFQDNDYENLLVIEPGGIRKRKLS